MQRLFHVAIAAVLAGMSLLHAESWTALNHLPTLRYAPDGCVAYQGGTVVYGSFDEVGDLVTSAVVFLSAEGDWVALGDGLDGWVTSAAVSGDDLYVAGRFSLSGEQPLANLARWDGEAWHDVGGGADDTINAIAIDDGGAVYIAGQFTAVGDEQPIQGLARYADGSWSAVGGFTDRTITALLWQDGWLYCGGSIDQTIDEVDLYRCARWNGTVWQGLVDRALGGHGIVQVLAPAADGGIYVGGGGDIGISPNPMAAHWKDGTWTGFGDFINRGWVWALHELPSGDLLVGGTSMQYQPPAAVDPIDLNALSLWDGADWSPFAGGVSRVNNTPWVDAIAVTDDGLTIVGTFDQVDDLISKNVARFDGTDWLAPKILGPTLPDRASAITCASDGTIYTAALDKHVYQRTEAGWLRLGEAFDDAPRSLVTDSAGQLFAGGRFTTIGATPALRVARWTGTAWEQVGDGLDNHVFDLDSDGLGNVYALGATISASGGTPIRQLARWDGSAWSTPVSSVTGFINRFEVLADGTIIVGGGMTRINGVTVHHSAIYADGAWSALSQRNTSLENDRSIRDMTVAADGRPWQLWYNSKLFRRELYRQDDDGHLRLQSVYSKMGDTIQIGGDGLLYVTGEGCFRFDGNGFTELSGQTEHFTYFAPCPDGSMLCSGSFVTVGEVVSPSIALYDDTDVPLDLTMSGPSGDAVRNSFNFEVRFSRPVDFAAEDLELTNVTLDQFFHRSLGDYALRATPIAHGPVRIAIPADACSDSFGYGNPARELVYLADFAGPVPALSAPEPVNGPFTLAIDCDELAYNFTIEDLEAVNGTLSDFVAVDPVGGGVGAPAQHFTVLVTPTGSDPVTVLVAAESFTDTWGNLNSAAELQVTVDLTEPLATLTAASQVSAPFWVTVAFSEAVTGLTADDFTIVGGLASLLTGEAADYQLRVTPTATGTISVQLPAAMVHDVAGNGNQASTALLLDASGPTQWRSFEVQALPGFHFDVESAAGAAAGTSTTIGDQQHIDGLDPATTYLILPVPVIDD